MDIVAIASAATAISQAHTAEAVSTTVLKKALDLEAQGAAQLIQAATQSLATYNNPPHLGQHIDILA